MQEFQKNSGLRIWQLREKAGYSREKLSEAANISAKFLYEIEIGKKGMSAYTLYNLANALNVSCDYILTGQRNNISAEHILNIFSSIEPDDAAHVEQILIHTAALLKNKKKK